MKKVIVLSILVTVVTTTFAQKELMGRIGGKQGINNNRNCYLKPTYKISQYTLLVLESYQKLINKNPNNCTSSNGTVCSFGVLAYPSINGVPAYNYSFTSYINNNIFRSVFSGIASSYAYYGVCPAPNLVPLPNPVYENHIWELKLVPIQSYVTAIDKKYASLVGIDISSIQSIDCIKMEDPTGYATVTEPAAYKSLISARGVVVYVTLKNGTRVLCYPFGNQDGLGNLQWKDNN